MKNEIEKAASRLITEPNVTVAVKEINSRNVFITGEVTKPGPYPLSGPRTVMQLIAVAGGLLEYADKDNIVVLRTDQRPAEKLQVQILGRVAGQGAGAEHRAAAWRHGRGALTWWTGFCWRSFSG